MFSASVSGSGMDHFSGKSLESLIKQQMLGNEPPMEHAILRLIINSSNLFGGHDNVGGPLNLNNVRMLNAVSIDTKKRQFSIVLPCSEVSEDFITNLNNVMSIYEYSFFRKHQFPEHGEYQIDYIRQGT